MLILASPSGGALGAFTDEFDSTLNARWSNTSGTWTTTSGDASTATAASSYPLASFNANTREVVLRAEGGTTNVFGWGVAFWVVDANNWWAVVADREEYTCQTGTTTGCCACGSDQCGPDGGCNCYSCDGGGCVGNCTFVANSGTCTYPVYGTCYRYKVKILKRESGTVTVMESATIAEGNIGGGLTIGYVQASINVSGQITATAQMSTGGAVASVATTPSSPAKSRVHGMIIVPKTTGTQASTIERYVYNPA